MEVPLQVWPLSLTADHVLRGQGADPHTVRQRRPQLVELAEWALQEGLPLLRPVVVSGEWRVVGMRHARLLLDGGVSLSGSLVVQHLAGARQVAVMLVTIGGEIEAMVSEMIRTEPGHALALDGLATAAVEQLAALACSRYETQAKAGGLQVSIPLSPGMVGWSVDPGQKQIFSLLGRDRVLNEAGVRLNDSMLMSPSKSLTEVIGMGENLSSLGRTCDYCSLKGNCRYGESEAVSAHFS